MKHSFGCYKHKHREQTQCSTSLESNHNTVKIHDHVTLYSCRLIAINEGKQHKNINTFLSINTESESFRTWLHVSSARLKLKAMQSWMSVVSKRREWSLKGLLSAIGHPSVLVMITRLFLGFYCYKHSFSSQMKDSGQLWLLSSKRITASH